MNLLKKKQTALLFRFHLEIDQELDDKTADIKKLAYEISTKLKSTFDIQSKYFGFISSSV